MPNSLTREAVYHLALDLGRAVRIFTLPQLARHPKLSELSQPVKRASECLRPYAHDFDKTEGAYGEPFRFRLSAAARKRLGCTDKAISGRSQKSSHWLALGDLYLTLRLSGGLVQFVAEPEDSAGFDCFVAYIGMPVLVEVQRTPITSREWVRKVDRREKFLGNRSELAGASWQPPGRVYRPLPLLVNLTGQEVALPRSWVHAKSMDEVPHLLRRYKAKMQEAQRR